jgi:hypothetical protein
MVFGNAMFLVQKIFALMALKWKFLSFKEDMTYESNQTKPTELNVAAGYSYYFSRYLFVSKTYASVSGI